MSRILLDENLPVGAVRLLAGHHVSHVVAQGWDGLANGALLRAAEEAGFEVFVTADRNLRYQQNLIGRRLAIVVLSNNKWALIKSRVGIVSRALASIRPGEVVEIDLRSA